MASQPKLRIFAGPNGSGKTTLFDSIKSIYFSTRLFVNTDLLEDAFKRNGFINLSDYNLCSEQKEFEEFYTKSGLYQRAKFNTTTWNLTIRDHVIVKKDASANAVFNSYHFAIVADFIRHELISNKVSFSFETVFSHPSKLDLIDLAHANHYKVYLYFIGTETPIMNLERIKDRVVKGGHWVDEEKIYKRYNLTMGLLTDMVKKVDESYLWDNSGLKHQFVGSIKKGVIELEKSVIPNWIDTYLFEKLN